MASVAEVTGRLGVGVLVEPPSGAGILCGDGRPLEV